jgi:uncharacterized membrane protein YedE/YeeE
MEIILGMWQWYVVGPLIALVMLSMFYFGKSFGVSSNFKNICAILGAGTKVKYFDIDWKSNIWNLTFIAGTLIGGFISKNFLMNYESLEISQKTAQNLTAYGIPTTDGLAPKAFFSFENLFSIKSLILVVLGGFLVGFGTRYAGGCTSGHAISGLSNLQLPSLVAVIGFFIGGLVCNWFILPLIFNL